MYGQFMMHGQKNIKSLRLFSLTCPSFPLRLPHYFFSWVYNWERFCGDAAPIPSKVCSWFLYSVVKPTVSAGPVLFLDLVSRRVFPSFYWRKHFHFCWLYSAFVSLFRDPRFRAIWNIRYLRNLTNLCHVSV